MIFYYGSPSKLIQHLLLTRCHSRKPGQTSLWASKNVGGTYLLLWDVQCHRNKYPGLVFDFPLVNNFTIVDLVYTNVTFSHFRWWLTTCQSFPPSLSPFIPPSINVQSSSIKERTRFIMDLTAVLWRTYSWEAEDNLSLKDESRGILQRHRHWFWWVRSFLCHLTAILAGVLENQRLVQYKDFQVTHWHPWGCSRSGHRKHKNRLHFQITIRWSSEHQELLLCKFSTLTCKQARTRI